MSMMCKMNGSCEANSGMCVHEKMDGADGRAWHRRVLVYCLTPPQIKRQFAPTQVGVF